MLYTSDFTFFSKFFRKMGGCCTSAPPEHVGTTNTEKQTDKTPLVPVNSNNSSSRQSQSRHSRLPNVRPVPDDSDDEKDDVPIKKTSAHHSTKSMEDRIENGHKSSLFIFDFLIFHHFHIRIDCDSIFHKFHHRQRGQQYAQRRAQCNGSTQSNHGITSFLSADH